jgi:small subunit ribosomal protein S12
VTNFFILKYVIIATIVQGSKRSKKYPLTGFSRTPALQKRPQVKGVVTRVTTMSPKKPNSASRHIAKVKLTNAINITGRIPGIGYICSKYNRTLINGGRANDLPGVGYTLIRGVYDFSPVLFKRKRRSVYGTRRPDNFTKHIRRSLRKNK